MPIKSPYLILENYQLNKITKESVISQLIELVEISDDIPFRLESIKILEKFKVKNQELFVVLENLLVSDSNWKIRKAAALYLKNDFFYISYKPIKWAFFNDDSQQCLSVLFEALVENLEEKLKQNLVGSRAFFIEEIKSIKTKEFRIGFEDLCLRKSIIKVKTEELADILINYYVFIYLSKIYWRLKIKIESCKITELDFIFKGLTSIPEVIKNLSFLRKLILRYNQLMNLPKWIGSLHSLIELNLNVNNIKSIPSEFGSLSELKYLLLWKNELSELPNSIGNLKSLKYLNLRLNMLNKLPDSICKLNELIDLNLHDNKIKKLPKSFGNLRSIKELNLSWNELIELPDSIGDMESLKVLDLERNELEKIPESIGSLKSLEILNLKDNKIQELPYSIKNLKSLKILNLNRNQIKFVPEFLSKLNSLEELYLGENKFEDLPNSLIFLEKKGLKIYY